MMASSRACKHDPDWFCYVCGIFLSFRVVKHRIKDANNFRSAYKSYFGVPVGGQDKKWAPHVVCGSYRSTLESWYRGESRRMKFGIPRIWREPTDHLHNCYFCVVDVSHHRRGTKTNVYEYTNVPSSLRPISQVIWYQISEMATEWDIIEESFKRITEATEFLLSRKAILIDERINARKKKAEGKKQKNTTEQITNVRQISKITKNIKNIDDLISNLNSTMEYLLQSLQNAVVNNAVNAATEGLLIINAHNDTEDIYNIMNKFVGQTKLTRTTA